MEFWKSKKGRILGIFLVVLVGVGAVPLFTYVFPHALNKQNLIDVEYFTVNDQPRVITFYQEVGNSDDGSYLSGYMLYLMDPATNKQLDKVFIKRSENDIPQKPDIYFFDNKEIWIIAHPGFVTAEKPFTSIIEIRNDKFNKTSTDFLNGWSVLGITGNLVNLSNQYNESGCLDIPTRKITNGVCPYQQADSPPPVQTSFFFVRNTPSSTRSKLYCYSTSTTFPPAGIFAGSTPPDGTIPGWHLMDAVNMAYGKVDEFTVKAYQAKFEKSETLVVVNPNQLFNSPHIVCSNDSICTLVSLNDDTKTHSFYQYSASGKLIWKVDCPSIKTSTNVYAIKSNYSKTQTILIHPENWVIAIDNASGKIKWKCPQ